MLYVHDPVANPVTLKMKTGEKSTDFKDRQDISDSDWTLRYDTMFPPRITIYPGEDLRGFFIMTKIGFENTSASLKAGVPRDITIFHPTQTPGYKRSNSHTEGTVDSEDEYMHIGMRE